jgi:hypothetical protein
VVIFGNSHAAGGSFHEVLLDGVLVATACFLVLLGALAWRAGPTVLNGSVLAGRIAKIIPGNVVLAGGAALWFTGIEALEPSHAGGSAVLTVVALIVAAALTGYAVRAIVRALAAVSFACSATAFVPLATVFVPRRPIGTAFLWRRLAAHRRFARPPPITA